jgi:glutamyl-tRNA synthetase
MVVSDYCDCTHEQVTARKGDNKTPGYDGFCRDRGLVAGASTALRFVLPTKGP